MPRNPWLIVGGVLSAAAAILHLLIIWGGPDWYLFFGAGPEMARAAENGHWAPALITGAIAAVLGIWSLYAFAGAGLVPRLPLMRPALAVISAIYLGRAFLFPIMAVQTHGLTRFNVLTSSIVLVFGLAYAIGTARAWPHLRRAPAKRFAGATF